jgi:hypothetical protein
LKNEIGYYLAVKRLQKSDLSWFEGPRRELEQAGVGRQRSVGIHTAVLKQIFPAHILSEDTIIIHEYHDNGISITGPNRRPLLRQHKNWRLGGDMVRDKRFTSLKPGDFMLMLFRQHEAGKWLLAWDTVGETETDLLRIALFEGLVGVCGTDGMWLLDEPDRDEVLQGWKSTAPQLLDRILPNSTIGGIAPIQRAISSKVQRNLMDLYISTVATLSPLDQREFATKLAELAIIFRKLLENDILKIGRDHKAVWKSLAGHRVGFVDGGTASISALGTEPLAIRVGTYTVVPGDQSPDRERFCMEPQLVDQLFGPDSLTRVFTADPDETQISKVRDIARIGLETAAALKAINEYPDLHYLFLHGPLVNPVSPYADCPEFSDYALAAMGLSSEAVDTYAGQFMPVSEQTKSHFITTYGYLLDKLFTGNVPVAGVIERSMSRAVALAVIQQRRGTSRRLYERVDEVMRKYRINDAMLFAAVLNEGEYIRPFQFDKNDPKRASPNWERLIASYHHPWTTYMMLRETSLPVRIELTHGEKSTEFEPTLSLIYHMSLLLPLYAFPVGLDIVDKYAKVPAWMSRQLTRHQVSLLLRHALESNDIKLYNQVRLMLTQNTREWYLRPKHNGL